MKIVNEFNNYVLYEYDSKSILEENIDVNQSILINDDCLEKRKFYGLSDKSTDCLIIGLFGELHGIDPSALFIDSVNCILINIDKRIYCIELDSKEVKWMKELDSIVYEMKKVPDFSFIAICELGVIRFTYAGEKLWEYTSDVITDFELNSNSLSIFTDEGDYSISLDKGSLV
ncbi:hypothetical protein ACIQ1H_09105 [Lysinibacillus sp. NPDC097279]|uniref:hypothetical protein n=1 Tax=Lysinibacillus sp. NPDC097279 TaxID=3364143 RepID=UPI0037F8A031